MTIETHRKSANMGMVEQSRSALHFVAADLTLSDPDQLGLAMRGWDVEWRQLHPGPTQHRVEVAACRQSAIQRFHVSNAMHQQGVAPEGNVTFGFAEPGTLLNVTGQEFRGPIVFDFNDPNGFDVVSGPDFRGISVSLARESFSRIATQMGLSEVEVLSLTHPIRSTGNIVALEEFRQYLRHLQKRLRREAETLDLRWVDEALNSDLPYRLLRAMQTSEPATFKQGCRIRHRRMQMAIEYIELNAHDNPSIPEICVASCLSARSLVRAFNEYFGIGPKRYLLNLRLTRVRQQLNSSPPGTKVADVANRWAFWHMGDFAREYRRMFGVHPAQTLPA